MCSFWTSLFYLLLDFYMVAEIDFFLQNDETH